jgi:hypothetical protein
MDKGIDAATNTNTFNQIGIINTDKTKKKPYDVKIKNNNPNEPKLRKSQILYSDKQNYRRYKTKIEPKLFSKIMVDDEEDLIAKIRKEFGIEDKTRKNYSEAETSGVPYYEEPNPIQGEEPNIVEMLRFELSDLSRNDMEDLLGEDVEGEVEEEEEDTTKYEIEDIMGGIIDTLEIEEEIEKGEANEALLTSLTIEELNKMTEEELNETSKELYKIASKYNFTYSGKKPKKPESILKRAQDIINEIANMNKTAETSEIVEKK